MKAPPRMVMALGVLLLGIPLYARVALPPSPGHDSVTTGRGAFSDPTRPLHADSVSLLPYPKKSPGTAMLLSAVLPGAGQFYNASYWKVPIVLGFGVYFISSWLDNNRRYEDYRDKYSASLGTTSGGDPRLLSVREFYKEQRDSFTWYFLVLYLVNIADAYVDASLFNFNVGGDLSLRLLPGASGLSPGGARVGLRMTL